MNLINCGWKRRLLTPQIVKAMKLTCILLTAAFLHVSAGGFSQKITLSEKNASLEKVFRSIYKQTGYQFVYNDETLKDAQKVTIEVKDVTLEEVLRICFQNQPLEYSFENNAIIVKQKVTSPGQVYTELADGKDISGRITDAEGKPLEGANVKVKGAGKGTTTNADGFFILKNVDESAVIEISFVGYETQFVPVKNKTSIALALKRSNDPLDEVQVIAYGTVSKRLNTGDVTTVKGEDIAKQPVTDPLLALQGRVPGLYIQQTSGIPGSYSTILLRGENSIPNYKPVTVNDPFFIVDGVPYSSASPSSQYIGGGAVGNPVYGRGQGLSPFNSLNPADIESIEVLKDADATAIYGSRGSNGVILITTKKGKAGKTRVDVDVSSGVSKVSRKIDLLNTQQYLAMRHEAFQNDGAVPDPNIDYDLTYWDTTRYTDWQKVLIGNTAHFTNAQASVSGGNANTQFQIGGGYSSQGTVFPGDYGDQKASLHFNITNASRDQKFKIQLTGSYVNDNSNIPFADFTGNITLAPDAPALYDANGNLNWALQGGGNTWINPMAATHIQAKAITDNLISNIVLSYHVLHDLQLKSSFGYTHSQMNQSQLSFSSASPPPGNASPYSRDNLSATSDSKSWIIEPQLDYHKQVGDWSVDGLLGTTFQENTTKSSSVVALGFSSDELVTDPAAASVSYLNGYNTSQYRYNGVFGRLGVRLKERYLLNITGRRDGSSRFGPAKQFGNFAAVGAGWIFSDERFIQNALPWLSFGKLRTSYGITGNDGIGDYQYLSTYSVYNPTYQGFTGLFPTLLSNPNFAWERNRKLEAGIELGCIKDRILLTTSYYRNRTDNQLVGYPLPVFTGFGSVEANLPALIQNTGWEFALTTVSIKTTDFAWSSSVNLSIPKNKLVSYPGIENSPYVHTYSVGKSLFTRWLYHSTGVDPQTGLYTFANKSGTGSPDYLTDHEFTKPVGQVFYGGFQNTFRYKGFELEVLFQFVKQTGFNYLSAFIPPGFASNVSVAFLNRWQKPGDIAANQQFTQTYTPTADAWSNMQQSDAIISDASFIRLKSMSLSYQFPSGWMKKMSIENASIFLHCENLWTISNYKLLDPESQGMGLPPLRTITAGIHVSL